MAAAGLERLGLWLHLRHRTAMPADRILRPEGHGPLLVQWVGPAGGPARAQVASVLRTACPDLRILDLSDRPEADRDRSAMTALLLDQKPVAILILGSDLPVALIAAAETRDIPVIMGETRLDRRDLGWSVGRNLRRNLLRGLHRLLVTDSDSHDIARRIGVAPSRVTMSGPVAEIRDPLPCNETERVSFAQLLRGRHAWFAACVPPAEEPAVIEAHRAALRQSHRALLILALTDNDRIAALSDQLEAEGLIVARRDRDEEPTDEVQVLLTDGLTEMGLWYRVAPVTYMGGTISGDDAEARHPFEPAALGSAILHGPHIGKFATDWTHLDVSRAARAVPSASKLAQAVAELTQPDLIAELANAAWTVSTGGAGVALQIAQPILDALERTGP